MCVALNRDRDHQTIHLRQTIVNFSHFLTPTLLPSAILLLLSVGKFDQFLTPPSPPKIAHFLNGWSHSSMRDLYTGIP